MGRGIRPVPGRSGNGEAEDSDARRRGPREDFHGLEGRREGGGEAGAPEGAFREVEVQPQRWPSGGEDGGRNGEVLDGANEVAIVEVPTVDEERRG